MIDMRRAGWRATVGLGVAMLALTACGDDDDGANEPTRPDATMPRVDGSTNQPDAVVDATAPDAAAGTTIVDIAAADPRFSTLVKALTDTGLVSTLAGAGPFTVFAPTDAAFDALPPGTLASLSSAELATILKYHVIAAEALSSALEAGPVNTVAELSAFVSINGGSVKVNDATVTTADVRASNGVIHIVDKVLLPPNLVDAAKFAGSFNTLLGAAQTAGLVSALSAKDANLTVFAPTDMAFAALPPGTVEGLSTTQLADVLKYHVLPSRVLSTALVAGPADTLLTGKRVTIALTGGPKVNEANIIITDVRTTNGVIHAIDKVLLPPAN